MSVEKIDFSYVSQEKKTFTTHLNSVLQNLRNPEALGLWAYLSSLPEGWIVNKEHLRKHFNLGRDKLDSILKYLVDNLLLEIGQERLNDGRMGKGFIYVRCGYDFKEDCKINDQIYPQKEPFTEKPLTAQPDTAKPGHGKSAPINKTKSFIKENKKIEREPLSENFKPDQEREAKARAVSQRCNISYEDLLIKFKAIEKKKNKTSTDWQADFELFLSRELPSKAKPTTESRSNQELRSTVKDHVPITHVKPASDEVVSKHLNSIKQLLSRKIVNGQPGSKSIIS